MKHLRNNWKFTLFLGFVFQANTLQAQIVDSSMTGLPHQDSIQVCKDSATVVVAADTTRSVLYDMRFTKFGNTVGRFGDAIIYSWAAPLRWKKKEWLTVGAVVGATALLFIADKPVNDFWGRQHSGVLHTIERIGYHYGKPYAAVIPMGGFYAAGVLFKSEWAKETAMILGSSYLSSGALQTIIKTGAGRARPSAGVGNMHFKPFSSDANYHSFPSGHIQIAMTTATVLANRVNNPYLRSFFYATAATTFISRMYSHSHWISDLFLGGVTSWYIAKTNVKRWKMTANQAPFTNMLEKKPKVTWKMGATSEGIGLVATFH